MDQGKVAHDRNQNVRFGVNFVDKRHVSLGTGSAQIGFEILLAERQ